MLLFPSFIYSVYHVSGLFGPI